MKVRAIVHKADGGRLEFTGPNPMSVLNWMLDNKVDTTRDEVRIVEVFDDPNEFVNRATRLADERPRERFLQIAFGPRSTKEGVAGEITSGEIPMLLELDEPADFELLGRLESLLDLWLLGQ